MDDIVCTQLQSTKTKEKTSMDKTSKRKKRLGEVSCDVDDDFMITNEGKKSKKDNVQGVRKSPRNFNSVSLYLLNINNICCQCRMNMFLIVIFCDLKM